MTPQVFLATVIEPAALLLPPANSPKARCLLLAIAGQESAWTRRAPNLTAPSHGFWRCEKNHAVLWVLSAGLTREPIHRVCDQFGVKPALDELFDAIETNEALAYCVARLLLIAGDPENPLPEIGERDRAWSLYERLWRAPLAAQDRWFGSYEAAVLCFDRTGGV